MKNFKSKLKSYLFTLSYVALILCLLLLFYCVLSVVKLLRLIVVAFFNLLVIVNHFVWKCTVKKVIIIIVEAGSSAQFQAINPIRFTVLQCLWPGFRCSCLTARSLTSTCSTTWRPAGPHLWAPGWFINPNSCLLYKWAKGALWPVPLNKSWKPPESLNAQQL